MSAKEEEQTPDFDADGAYQELLETIRQHQLKTNIPLIEKAYEFSKQCHRTQKRVSGEPYIVHPLGVAKILAELRLDTSTIATAILHDTVEDTSTTLKEIEQQFGPEITSLVDGVTKISQITFQTTEEKQAENFRKMILAMAKDLRVILVKLADRTHNMRTLDHLPHAKQLRIAQETLDIYAPLANRLGLSAIKKELEDLALRYSKPEVYYRLVRQVAKKRQEREKHVEELKLLIESALKDHGYENADVSGRPKHFYSIHQKMEAKNLDFEQVFDITGFRIIVDTVEQCYGALGIIHSIWTPVPGRIKDYIAIPKPNFYQSLHTTVIGPSGEHIEIQIRTHKMNETAEYGIAAHWAYKEGSAPGVEKDQFSWLNRLIEGQRDLADPNEFLESVKLDLFTDEVYVFTPKGAVMEFPQGSCPIDFAYAIHTDVGHHCMGARVDGRMVPLKYKLKSGDTLEIITSPNQQPNKDWLKLVKTSRAKSKIRSFIKAQEHERAITLGEVILDKELRKYKLTTHKLLKDKALDPIAESFSLKSAEDLLSAIGYGKVTPGKAISRIVHQEVEEEAQKEPKGPLQQMFDHAAKTNNIRKVVKVKGIDDLLVRFARCCNPVPGDSVVGFITRGRGISVHTRNCPKIFDSDSDRLVEIDWDDRQELGSKAKVKVVCQDKAGLLADMSNVIKDFGINITRAQVASIGDHKAQCLFTLEIRDKAQLHDIISKIEGVEGVISVSRIQRNR